MANLIGLYGEVDRIAARADAGDVRDALGSYFRGYRRQWNVAEGDSAVGWFDQFLIATEQQQLRRELRPEVERPVTAKRLDPDRPRKAPEQDPMTEAAAAIEEIDDTLEALAEAVVLAPAGGPPVPAPPLRDPDAPPPPSTLPTSFEALEHFARTDPTPRDFSKRLLAISVLMRVYPELRPGGDQAVLVTNALVGATGWITNEARVDELHALLHTEFTSMGAWSTFLGAAMRDGLVDPSVMYLQEHAPPCVGDLDWKTNPLDPAGRFAAVELETSFPVPIPFDQAIHYLYPTNWRVSPLWCVMSSYDDSQAPYVEFFDEEVSLDCGTPGVWCVQTKLRFTFSRKAAVNGQPRRASAEYMLPGPPLATDDILVDQGYLKIIEDGNGVILKTKKVVRFNDPTMDGPQMAMLMCPLGYAAGVENAILNSTLPGFTADPFPIGPNDPGKHPHPPVNVVAPGATYRTTPAAGTATGNPNNGALVPDPAPGPGTASPDPSSEVAGETAGDLVGDSVDYYQQYLQETAAEYQAAYAKLATGTYRIEDYYGDMSRMWGRGLRGLSVMADLAQRAMGLKAPALYDQPAVDPTDTEDT